MSSKSKREQEQEAQREAERQQNEQQEGYLERQEKADPTVPDHTKVGGDTPPPTGGLAPSEAQTSPHKLPDALGTPTEGSPSGADRRLVKNRSAGRVVPYTGPERRKSNRPRE